METRVHYFSFTWFILTLAISSIVSYLMIVSRMFRGDLRESTMWVMITFAIGGFFSVIATLASHGESSYEVRGRTFTASHPFFSIQLALVLVVAVLYLIARGYI